MVSHGDVDDAATVVRQDHQDEQEAARRGGDHEEVRGHELSHVIRQEGAPRLRRRSPMTDHVFRDAGLTDVNPEFQEFAVDPRCAPERIRCGHRANQRADVRRHGLSTQATTALPCPEKAEASAMPGEDRLGLDEHERGSPFVPYAR